MKDTALAPFCPEEQAEWLSIRLTEAQAGSQEAFGRIVGSLSPQLLRRAATSLTTSSGEAEELVQDVWVRAWQKIHTFESGRHLRQWLYVVLRNCGIDKIRRRRSRQDGWYRLLRRQSMAKDLAEQPGDLEEREAFEVLMSRFLEGLSDRRRRIVRLHYESGRSTREIGALLGAGTSAIKMELHRARKLAAVRMGQD